MDGNNAPSECACLHLALSTAQALRFAPCTKQKRSAGAMRAGSSGSAAGRAGPGRRGPGPRGRAAAAVPGPWGRRAGPRGPGGRARRPGRAVLGNLGNLGREKGDGAAAEAPAPLSGPQGGSYMTFSPALEENTAWGAAELARLRNLAAAPAHGLVVTRGSWEWEENPETGTIRLKGLMELHNVTARSEVFVTEVAGQARVLSGGAPEEVRATAAVAPRHDLADGYPPGDSVPRKDGYWSAYILQAGAKTALEVTLDVTPRTLAARKDLQSLVFRLDYVAYGPHGRTEHSQHLVLPLSSPSQQECQWAQREGAKTLAIPTHLLCHLDNPATVASTYAKGYAQPGDIFTIGETPVGIMQGRYRHPSAVRPGLLARLACRLFYPTSSVATACGMQALIDAIGAWRVFCAAVAGVVGRLFGKRGVFYRVAGEQAALIDDVTGTLAPYDQFITLGPTNAEEIVEDIRRYTGMEAAIVDVNDLSRRTGAVRILAATEAVDQGKLRQALLSNPAGNADEQTPIVLVRFE